MIRFLISLVVGAVSGWIAGQIMKEDGSWLKNMILGIVGGVVGGFLLGLVGIGGHNILGDIIISVIGACIVIAAGRYFFGTK